MNQHLLGWSSFFLGLWKITVCKPSVPSSWYSPSLVIPLISLCHRLRYPVSPSPHLIHVFCPSLFLSWTFRHQFIWTAKYKNMIKAEFSEILARRCQAQLCKGWWQELKAAYPQSWAESTELIHTCLCLPYSLLFQFRIPCPGNDATHSGWEFLLI